MWLKPVLAAMLAACGVFALAVVTKQPSHARAWQPHLSRLPVVARDGDRFSISQYRSWAYSADVPVSETWHELAPHDIRDVRRAWFVVEPHPGLAVMAHTLVLFEFADDDLIGLTVEARKEAGESYSALRGALNAFELVYEWATPRDLLTRRAVMMDRELYMYPLALSQDETEAYLDGLLQKTEAIERRARFYNTATSNCTNELAKTAGLSWDPAFILTGYSAKALHRMRRIAADGDFESVRAHARIDSRVRDLATLPDAAFNAELLKASRDTFGLAP
ncbi:DUF4105 domain-containing protein [Hyphomonas johnsonii]|uniref:Lnb N-terminal periplasmic domain-containing protein n=1 Tax=Hyphomonas johnsonii MHS-2 TaxID=1280950 RepID=A0A059FPV1_9PROT|nr:DUF4105 domain-containing protein [Hyphomonas johnsonii]KCZ92689.1 hypothetical protein HJO_07037 [Hyphomonas johnsonii MHS-2]